VSVPVEPAPVAAGVVETRPPGGGPLPAGLDGLLRGLGGLLALAAGAVAGLLAVVLVPLRVADAGDLTGLAGLAGTGFGAVRVPVAIVVAAGGNLLLVRFAEWATGARWGAVLPALGWFPVIWMALRTTAEGDRLLVPDDWVGTLALFGGTVAMVIAITVPLAGPRPGATRPGLTPRAGGPGVS
jgi:hypothetical protein